MRHRIKEVVTDQGGWTGHRHEYLPPDDRDWICIGTGMDANSEPIVFWGLVEKET